MAWKTHNNFILISVNILSLAHFITPRSSWTLIVFLYFTHTTKLPDIKLKLQIIALLSLFAAFITIPLLAQLLSASALGLAMNTGYQIDSAHAPWVINCALALGVIFGHITSLHITKYATSRDVILLIFTLPNFFMAEKSKQSTNNTSLQFIGPFLDMEWTYSLGFISGIFFPFGKMAKHIRFFIISIILLLTLFTDNKFYDHILFFIRGIFIYNQTKHISEYYFRMGFIGMDLLLPRYLFNYLFIGYLIIAVILWQDHARENMKYRRLSMLEQPFIGQEMQEKGSENMMQNRRSKNSNPANT